MPSACCCVSEESLRVEAGEPGNRAIRAAPSQCEPLCGKRKRPRVRGLWEKENVYFLVGFDFSVFNNLDLQVMYIAYFRDICVHLKCENKPYFP